MTDVIFNDFYLQIQKFLLGAKYDVKIAVAWINFKAYNPIFTKLLDDNVKLQIIVNDDFINSKYNDIIALLSRKGAIVYKRKMPTTRQYMHEKFCIIDSSLVLCGSYNWSQNANKNFENLVITDEELVARKFLNEFDTIIGMNIRNIQQLCCCASYNILILEQEGNSTVGIICNAHNGELRIIEKVYSELSVLYNLSGICDKYDSFFDQLYGEPYELEQINAEFEFEMQQYLGGIKQLLNIPDIPIHGIGRIARDMYYGDVEDVYIKIIWKERFCVLSDRYEWNN